MHMEVRALFGRFVCRRVDNDDVTIHPFRGSGINATLEVCEHNRVAHASVAFHMPSFQLCKSTSQ